MAQGTLRLVVPIRTSNPLNGATGNSRVAGILKAKRRKAQRETVALAIGSRRELVPCDVTITRVAPSRGLDPHDGLGAALKGAIDGVADALGLADDRDPRVAWRLAQRRGKAREYAVEIEIAPRAVGAA